jgi:opacity protein-like surface antigen
MRGNYVMKKLSFLESCAIIIFLIISSVNYAQDSSKIVILSDEVGAVIDLNERNNYGFFTPFKENFIHAFIFLTPDSQYNCKVRYKSGELLKDTVLVYNYGSIRSMATKVQYMESQKKGITNFDLQNDVKLKFADGEEVKNIITIDSRKTISELPYKKNAPLYKLNSNYSQFIENDFEAGFSAGVIFNKTKFEGLNQLFNVLEENIPEEPYVIEKSNASFEASPLLRFSGIIIYRKTLMGEIGYDFNITDGNYPVPSYQSLSFSLSYLFQILENLSPYFSIGYSGAKFKIVQNYGIQVNNSSGTLESITFEGISKGFKGSAGVLYDVSKNLSINLFGSYKFFPEAELNQGTNPSLQTDISVEMKGFEVGFGIIVKSF